ncbi:MAG: hypothetical protein WCT28_03940 [Patescibacteria group bacterium]|jgi:hypothetical protein
MTPQSIVVVKRRFFVGKTTWIFATCVLLLCIGVVIQLRMTWSREHIWGITSDAHDAVAAVETGAKVMKPDKNPFEPLLQLFQEFSETTPQ